MRIAPRRAARALSLPMTPLVDILLILLIFFMLTSTFLDLDMIPIAEPAGPAAEPGSPSGLPGGAAVAARPLLVRLDAEGVAVVAGIRAAGPELASALRRRLSAEPGTPVVVLPSPQAPLQALVDLLAALSAAGAPHVSVLRIEEARP